MNVALERTFAVTLACLALALGSFSGTWADSPAVTYDAGAIVPIDNRWVKLDSIDVDIRLAMDAPQGAVCTYVMTNVTRRRQTVDMAFVTRTPRFDSNGDPAPREWFRVLQDGAYRTVRMRPVRRDFLDGEWFGVDSLPCWRITLAPGARTHLKMEYSISWSDSPTGEDHDTAGEGFTYFAAPAARWAGKVDHAVFRFHLGGPGTIGRLQRSDAPWKVHLDPAGFRWLDDGLVWEFRNWEPNCDLSISVDDDWADPCLTPWSPDSIAELPGLTVVDRMPALSSKPAHDTRDDYYPRPADTVRVRVRVDTLGLVRDAHLPGPSRMMEGEALQWVRMWRFAPAELGGRPVDCWTDVSVIFDAVPERKP